MRNTSSSRAIVLIAALGYFVDIYDLILFSIVRIKSLKALGIADDALLSNGVLLLNLQMTGMLIGGICWGILGDKRGRLSVLLGSIFLYSIANMLNAFVHDLPSYAFLRLIAGIGLAGELGAGITLVCEAMPKESRAWGTTLVATVGVLGAVVAALVGGLLDWRLAYFVGGVMGLALLLLRFNLRESMMFEKILKPGVPRGNFFDLFKNRVNFTKYLRCILIGVPLWFVVGILITFAPEFGKAIGMLETPSAAHAVLFAYIGLAVGDLVSGSLSQIFKSRKKIALSFMVMNAVFMFLYLYYPNPSLFLFYSICFLLGFASGYWAIFVTIAAEQFGTNLRSTVAATVPNFVRGSVVPLTSAFILLRVNWGLVPAASIIAFCCVVVAFTALMGLPETHGKDLDYLEPTH